MCLSHQIGLKGHQMDTQGALTHYSAFGNLHPCHPSLTHGHTYSPNRFFSVEHMCSPRGQLQSLAELPNTTHVVSALAYTVIIT